MIAAHALAAAASAANSASVASAADEGTHAPLRVIRMTDRAAFEAARTQWESLTERVANPHPFLTHAWLCAWFRHLAGAARPFILVAADASGWVGALALARTAAGRLRPVTLHLPVNQESANLRGGMIAAPRHAERVAQLLAADLCAGHARRDWTRLCLDGLMIDGPVNQALLAAFDAAGLARSTWRLDCALFRLARTDHRNAAAWLASRSQSFRKSQRLNENRLARAGAVRLSSFHGDAPLDAVFALDAACTKAKVPGVVALRGAVADFHRELARAFGPACRTDFLELDGQCIASMTALTCHGTLFLLHTAHIEAARPLAPGRALLANCVAQLFAGAYASIDINGRTGFVSGWTEAATPVLAATLYRRSLAGRLAHLREQVLPELLRPWTARRQRTLHGPWLPLTPLPRRAAPAAPRPTPKPGPKPEEVPQVDPEDLPEREPVRSPDEAPPPAPEKTPAIDPTPAPEIGPEPSPEEMPDIGPATDPTGDPAACIRTNSPVAMPPAATGTAGSIADPAVPSHAHDLPDTLRDRAVLWYRDGRSALAAGLAALGLPAGSEVLFPAYHCGAEAEALRAAGLALRPYRVPRDLRLRECDLALALTPATRALYAIHYLGLAQDGVDLAAFARAHGLLLIEDCAQALYSASGSAQRVPVGRHADLALFSLHKFLPLAEGGALVMRPDARAAPPRVPGRISRLRTWLLAQRLRAAAGCGWCAATAACAAGALAGLVERTLPRTIARATGMARGTAESLVHAPHQSIARLRRAHHAQLVALCADRPRLEPMRRTLAAGDVPLLFGVTTDHPEELVWQLEGAGIEAGLHWGAVDPRFALHEHPDAVWLKTHLVVLPVHQDLGAADFLRIERVLDHYAPRRAEAGHAHRR